VLSRGADPVRMALAGALLGVPAFAAVIAAASTLSVVLLALGVLFIGMGAGLFGHGTLTLTMNRAAPDEAGLALGAWGAVQATAAGAGMALGGLGRDAMQALASRGWLGEALNTPAAGYAVVYTAEIVLLLATAAALLTLLRGQAGAQQRGIPQPQQQWSAP
jgi:BCD family chlorophyll transporter-like MFS transporter